MDVLQEYGFAINFVLNGTIFIGLFIILILIKSKTLKQNRFVLALLIFFLILHLLTYLLFTSQIIKTNPNLLGISYPTLFLLGPLLYFFTKNHNTNSFRLKWHDALHLLPFLIVLSFHIPYYFKSFEHKKKLIDYYYTFKPALDFNFLNWVNSNLYIFLLFSYAVASLIFIKRKIKNNKRVLTNIAVLIITLSLCNLMITSGLAINGASVIVLEVVLAIALVFGVLFLAYWIVDVKNVLMVNKKYKYSPLSETEINKIEKALIKTIETNKLYLNPKLKISDLSVSVNVPSHHISQVLNDKLNIGFYDFINSYRINKAKEMLLDGTATKLSIQAVGEECGFNNKNSFYKAFKTNTGNTPKEFMKLNSDIK